MFPSNYFKISEPLISRVESRAKVDTFCYPGNMLECLFTRIHVIAVFKSRMVESCLNKLGISSLNFKSCLNSSVAGVGLRGALTNVRLREVQRVDS